MLELVTEGGRLSGIDEVPVLQAPCRDRVHDTVDNLAKRGFPSLLERDHPCAVVADAGVTELPDNLVVGMAGLRGEVSLDADSEALSCNGH